MKNKMIKSLALAGILTGALALPASAADYRYQTIGYTGSNAYNGYSNYSYNNGIDSVKENRSPRNISNIQDTLIGMGYFVGPNGVTGAMNPLTVKAVKQFQADNGIKIDGVVGDETAAALNGNWNKMPSNYSSNIASVQTALMQLGYFVGPSGVTGTMNNTTREAVKWFQMQNSMEANGLVDTQTANALSVQLNNKWQQPVSYQMPVNYYNIQRNGFSY